MVKVITKNKFQLNKYDGETDYAIYQLQFKEVAAANGWNEQEKKTALLQALTGHATEVIATLHHQSKPITLENLEEILLRQYSKQPMFWERKQEFDSLVQKPGQTLREFARLVERKGRACYRNAPEKDIQESLVERFCKGITDKQHARALPFGASSTLDEAVNTLSKAKAILGDEPPAKRARLLQIEGQSSTYGESDTSSEERDASVNMVFPSGSSTGPSGSQTNVQNSSGNTTDGSTNTSNTGIRGRGRGRGRGRPRGTRNRGGGRGGYSGNNNNVTCSHCGKQGHTEKDCWSKNGQGSSSCNYCGKQGHFEKDCWSKSGGQNNNKNFQENCYNCGKSGHRARDCWSPPNNHNRGNNRGYNNNNNRGWNNNSNMGYLPDMNCPPDVVQAAMLWYRSQENQRSGGNSINTQVPAIANVPFVPSNNNNNQNQNQGN
ncbi:hypothetical protein ONE63_000052 [Megalurothrips usitatus]|uniref:CCHC-type domain-containing protein n=1 Tax=Megalurothrips usitatus TaxID=439358 RepID=A0AAV7XXA2_9NEOP|nr:hypothetical protein ONE63_000052 [Megalurothrips usitatus]